MSYNVINNIVTISTNNDNMNYNVINDTVSISANNDCMRYNVINDIFTKYIILGVTSTALRLIQLNLTFYLSILMTSLFL